MWYCEGISWLCDQWEDDSFIIAAILLSSSPVGTEVTGIPAPTIGGLKEGAGRAVSVLGWKKRRPGAAGTLLTMTDVFLGMIIESSTYSRRELTKAC